MDIRLASQPFSTGLAIVVVRNDCAMPSPVELEVSAPFAGVVVAVEHTPGASVQAGAVLVVLEAMKMEHEVARRERWGRAAGRGASGDAIEAGELLVVLRADDGVARRSARGRFRCGGEAEGLAWSGESDCVRGQQVEPRSSADSGPRVLRAMR